MVELLVMMDFEIFRGSIEWLIVELGNSLNEVIME